jgi:hypothetical protein
MKIWECFDGLAAQQWFYTDDNRIALENQGLSSVPVCQEITVLIGMHQDFVST